MNSKGKSVGLKHRVTSQKKKNQRIIARRLLKGEITTDQVRLLVGNGYSGVLKTVDYIVSKEGSTISPILASDIAMALTPAINSSWETTKRKPIKNTQKRDQKTESSSKSKTIITIGQKEMKVKDSAQPKPVSTRKRKIESTKEDSSKIDTVEGKPKPKPKSKSTTVKKTSSDKSTVKPE
jgi:hypothetical protein